MADIYTVDLCCTGKLSVHENLLQILCYGPFESCGRAPSHPDSRVPLSMLAFDIQWFAKSVCIVCSAYCMPSLPWADARSCLIDIRTQCMLCSLRKIDLTQTLWPITAHTQDGLRLHLYAAVRVHDHVQSRQTMQAKCPRSNQCNERGTKLHSLADLMRQFPGLCQNLYRETDMSYAAC